MKISGRPTLLVFTGFICYALAYCILIWLYGRMIAGYFQDFPNQLFAKSIIALILGVAIIFFGAFWRLPLYTKVENNILTTYNVLGRRSIDLRTLSTVKPFLLLGGRATTAFGIVLYGAGKRRVYLHLGSMSRKQRAALFGRLRPFILKPSVRATGDSLAIFQRWSPAWQDHSHTRTTD